MTTSNEKIVETKTCRLTGTQFTVTDKDLDFYDAMSPVFGGKKYTIPTPTLCPDERIRLQLTYRNERFLYPWTCEKTGKKLLTIYENPTQPLYSRDYWWSDDWSAFDYWRAFDFSRTFSENMLDLLHVVPVASRNVWLGLENCPYINSATYCKDCHLVFGANYCESCYYSRGILKSKNCINIFQCTECELCYECIDCEKCYSCRFSQNSSSCTDSAFLFDCRGCRDCVNCTGLRNKQYYINNKPHSKEEYEKIVSDPDFYENNLSHLRAAYADLHAKSVRKALLNIDTEDTIANYARHTKDVTHCFDIEHAENCKFCCNVYNQVHNCYDVTCFGNNIEWNIACSSVGFNSANNGFLNYCWENVNNCWYSQLCPHGNTYLFWCAGVRQSEYCIFNTSFGKQEYEEEVGKIIDHMRETDEWGEFFPPELSDYAYNETAAQDFMPLSQSEAEQKGFRWRHSQERAPEEAYIPLPISQYNETAVDTQVAKDNIDACVSGVLVCEKSNRPYKVLPQELAFYIEQRLPIPRLHPDERITANVQKREPRYLGQRTCDQCNTDMYSSYAPDRPETVYCEACYEKEVY